MTIRIPLPIAVLACVGALGPMARVTAYQVGSPARIESTRGQANGQSNDRTRADSRAQTELPEGSVGGGDGNCCIANGSPGCDDPDCEAAICAADPFCCDVTWDDVCAEAAANEPLCDCG